MCIWEAAAGSNIRLVLASSSVQAEQTTTYTYDVLSRHSQHGQLSSDSSEATQLLSAILLPLQQEADQHLRKPRWHAPAMSTLLTSHLGSSQRSQDYSLSEWLLTPHRPPHTAEHHGQSARPMRMQRMTGAGNSVINCSPSERSCLGSPASHVDSFKPTSAPH